MCEMQALNATARWRPAWLWALWRHKGGAAPSRLCICRGRWQQEEAGTVTEPAQLPAVLLLLHTTYQKGLRK